MSGEPQSTIDGAPAATGLTAALVDAAAVVVAWTALLLAEQVALGFLWRDQFSAAWEIDLARRLVVPIAVAALAPASLAVVAGWKLASGRAGGSSTRRVFAAAGALAAAAVALGVSNGRHFGSWYARGPFVATLALAGAMSGRWGVPGLVALGRRPVVLACLGLSVAVSAWLADAYVLPRLYPAFHVVLVVATLLGAGLVALATRLSAPPRPGRLAVVFAAGVGLGVLLCFAWAPYAARALDRAANLRLVLVEHAPLLGRTVAVASRVWPPVSDDATAATVVAPNDELARSLDWTGRDVLLLSVDALRADHVSSYGYARATTPNIDALAKEGALFEDAYCPTPHTSYSIASMMTGKYLRPLLALGLGADSETWAQHLRRYGWRTAAFYPPAVFFIDEDRFLRLQRERLGFEYAKVEFADPALRERQVAQYLDEVPSDRSLFLWVHFFEPHEPYVVHPEHVFTGGPSADVDAYDSEVATADDGIGLIVHLVRARRPDTVIVVTADHGEEFGEHGGRYHGTTVYEEQVRVPLVVVGPGVRRGARISCVVQTIDLLPTALSALGIPRPARLRGRDLGSLLSGTPCPGPGQGVAGGFAFAETDDYALVASGADRLICERRAAACALYRPKEDPLERHDRTPDDSARAQEMRSVLRATERDHGRYEAGAGAAWPEALRRGVQGEVDAAPDVASLLEDADVTIRRKAAEVCFELHAAVTAPELRRAATHDDDDEVTRWSALALVRIGEPMPRAEALLEDPVGDWRRRAALALAERGEARACPEIAAWWGDIAPPLQEAGGGDRSPPRLSIDLVHAEELLAATTKARCRSATPALVRALDDVRARPYVADALGALGDDRAGRPLLARLLSEPYVTARPHEARALLALGVQDWSAAVAEPEVQAALPAPLDGSRLVALLSNGAATFEARADGVLLTPVELEGEVRSFELGPTRGRRIRIDAKVTGGGVVALWLASTSDLIEGPRSRK